MAERIGITMRVMTSRHGESRDCLARDWPRFMAVTLPRASWMPLPNTGEAIVDLAAQWQLDGFIFSGGNDLGQCHVRDATEQALLEHSLKHCLPVFGVCRGLQFLQRHFGGVLERCRRETHVATRHPVSVRTDRLAFDTPPEADVNSYHEWAVPEPALAPELELLAASEDGLVEAARHREAAITAVQWHPERDQPSAGLDRDLLLNTMKGGH